MGMQQVLAVCSPFQVGGLVVLFITITMIYGLFRLWIRDKCGSYRMVNRYVMPNVFNEQLYVYIPFGADPSSSRVFPIVSMIVLNGAYISVIGNLIPLFKTRNVFPDFSITI